MYAEVHLPIAVNQTFSYLIPKNLENEIKKGSLVRLPFANRSSIGYIEKIIDNKSYKGDVKAIDSIVSNIIVNMPDLKKLIDWMHHYYLTPKGLVVKNILSFLFKKNQTVPKKQKIIRITKKGVNAFNEKRIKGTSRIKILEKIYLKKDFIKISDLKKYISISSASIETLIRDKYIHLKEIEFDYNPLEDVEIGENIKNLTLSEKQNQIFKKLKQKIDNDCFSVNLIHGITGSGKTEIYIKLVEDLLKEKKTALILVPEIVLTPETARRFKLYFQDKVGIWNSSMTYAEKRWTWENLLNQNLKIIIGTRSSIFLPIKNLSTIIVDEEHDNSYKQMEGMPTYNARDIAIIRAKNLNIPAIMGSATPSIESYYNSASGKYNFFELMERYGSATYPEVKLVNMFEEKKENQIFSRNLLENIENRLKNKEQIILLHNRRGYASILQCLGCGYIFTSSKTSAPLTYHRTYNQLLCHHTEERYNIPKKCVKCDRMELKLKGVGTEQIEDKLNKFFPRAKILRFDADSTSKKNAYKIILKDFENHKADILIGTQMVSKGFDFHNVTLVGVLNADIGLFSPDFRSGERIFQLLYQVCGRAGRGTKPGKAIIQSFNISDPYIQSSSIMDTKKYYNILLEDRLSTNYPPFSKIIRVLLKGKNLIKMKKQMEHITKNIKDHDFEILGPVLAPIEKINNLYRLHIIIKTKKPLDFQNFYLNNKSLKNIFDNLKDIKYQFDVDPLSLL